LVECPHAHYSALFKCAHSHFCTLIKFPHSISSNSLMASSNPLLLHCGIFLWPPQMPSYRPVEFPHGLLEFPPVSLWNTLVLFKNLIMAPFAMLWTYYELIPSWPPWMPSCHPVECLCGLLKCPPATLWNGLLLSENLIMVPFSLLWTYYELIPLWPPWIPST